MNDPLSFSELYELNSTINSQVIYTTDKAQFGKAEHWQAATTMGDCEDYALRKRQVLIERGVEPSLLKLATCWTETKEYHAVLIVTTPIGDFILDNRMKSPMIKQDIGYTWDKIQIGSKWYKL